MIASSACRTGAARPAQTRAAPRTRAGVARAGPQRGPAPAQSDPGAPSAPQNLLAALETAAVVAAVGAHVAAAVAAHRRQAAAQATHASAAGSRRVAQAVPAPAMHSAAAEGGWLAPGGPWFTLPLVAALVLGRLRAWLAPSPAGSARRVSAEAAARLLRAEAATGQHAQRIDDLARQLDKLSVRARLTGRDIKLPLQQLQAAAGQQAEALVAVAERMERLEKDIRGTEELVAAMQGVSAKQFKLLLKVVEQQAQQAQRQAQQPAQQPAQQQRPAASRGGGAPAGAGGASSSAKPSPPPAPAAQRQQQQRQQAPAGGATDEWDRTVVPLPPSAVPQQPAAPPAAPSSPPASASGTSSGVLGLVSSAADAAAAAIAEASADSDDDVQLALGGARAAGGGAGEGAQGEQAAAAQAQEAGQEGGKKGLSLDSFLGIIKEDEYFKTEQQIISAVVNSPKKPQKPEVEILPPLYPQLPEPASPEEAARAQQRRDRIDEWRQRMRRSWDASRLEAALEASSGDEEEAPGAGVPEGGPPTGGGAGAAWEQQGVGKDDTDEDGTVTFRF